MSTEKKPLHDPPPGEFYTFSVVEEHLRSRRDALSVAGVNRDERAKQRETFRGIQTATQLPDRVLILIADADVDRRVAGSADDAAIEEGNRDVRARLIDKFGSAAEAEAVLERVQKFVREHEPLAEILREGPGARVDVIEGIAEHVTSTGYR